MDSEKPKYKFTTKDLLANSMILALYVVLTMVTYPVSFLGIQFRIAEVMVLLVFFRKDYAIGLILGCAVANLPSTIGLIDVAFGTMATALACVCIMFCKQLAVACIFPVLFNAFIVGFELYQFLGLPFWISTAEVALGETAVMLVGYIFFMIIKRRKKLFEAIRANQNLEFKW